MVQTTSLFIRIHPNLAEFSSFLLLLPIAYCLLSWHQNSSKHTTNIVQTTYKHSANIVQTTSLFIRIHPNFAEFSSFLLPILPNRYNRYAKISTYSNFPTTKNKELHQFPITKNKHLHQSPTTKNKHLRLPPSTTNTLTHQLPAIFMLTAPSC
jgi:hypothetical protein